LTNRPIFKAFQNGGDLEAYSWLKLATPKHDMFHGCDENTFTEQGLEISEPGDVQWLASSVDRDIQVGRTAVQGGLRLVYNSLLRDFGSKIVK
jgi:hypothetical protein